MEFHRYNIDDIEKQLIAYVHSQVFLVSYQQVLSNIEKIKREVSLEDNERISYLKSVNTPNEMVDIMCMLHAHRRLSSHDDLTSYIFLNASKDDMQSERGYDGIVLLHKELKKHIERLKYARQKVEKREAEKVMQSMIDRAKSAARIVRPQKKHHL